MNSNYIAFEGIDGSGKTSIIENLSDILNSQNKKQTPTVQTLQVHTDWHAVWMVDLIFGEHVT